ncbi:hypothetical protein CR513_36048, partial [Mucuna pruriens]
MFGSYDLSLPRRLTSNPCNVGKVISRASGGGPLNEDTLTTLSALTQFYDPPLKCFTFKDFQLTPMLEEYERLLGMPQAKSLPYFPRGHYPSWALVAKLLRVPESKVLRQKKN